jgi:uncharacterized membrane protein YebE (DUF533 family)
MTSTGKIITWTAVIAVVGIGGYIGYAAYKKKKEEAAAGKPKISAADAQSIGAGLGSFIKNLFTKTPVVTEPAANSATGKVKHPKSVGTRGLIY